ncbi:hypothetical protein ACJX0J_015164, partial [Zea mays]
KYPTTQLVCEVVVRCTFTDETSLLIFRTHFVGAFANASDVCVPPLAYLTSLTVFMLAGEDSEKWSKRGHYGDPLCIVNINRLFIPIWVALCKTLYLCLYTHPKKRR